MARTPHDHVRQRAEALVRAPQHPGELARLLVLEQRAFQAEAEVRRLDHCEARLAVSSARRKHPRGSNP
ncbi:hypothetical protein ACFU3E_05430 [Streptomyces sp. NPDC057424]|uniref:hypothetical protein n=1 Tax=Streptomyces sp. NPDC057424 TaxID=3346127 RepID=UPI0036769A5D